jgi:hypothetical protein
MAVTELANDPCKTALHRVCNPSVIQAAAPDNLDPSRQLPSPLLPPSPSPSPPKFEEYPKSTIVLDNSQTNFHSDFDDFGQRNYFMDQSIQWVSLITGEKIGIKTGTYIFSQPNVESVIDIPLQITWERKFPPVKVSFAGGVDIFDRLPAKPNIEFQVETPLRHNLNFRGSIAHSAYKGNVPTLNNQITNWRWDVGLSWQIDRDTSLSGLYRWGNYSDGNYEQQSTARLERKLGKFLVGANLFTWSYTNDVQATSGYFSPPDLLVYHADISWTGAKYRTKN